MKYLIGSLLAVALLLLTWQNRLLSDQLTTLTKIDIVQFECIASLNKQLRELRVELKEHK